MRRVADVESSDVGELRDPTRLLTQCPRREPQQPSRRQLQTPPQIRRSHRGLDLEGTTVITADSPFGSMLYDASGQAIICSMLSAAPDPSATASGRTPGRRC